MSNEKTVHQKNLEHLAKERYKFVNGLSPPIMTDFFWRNSLHTTLEFFGAYIPTIRKLPNIESNLLHARDHIYEILFQRT